MDNPQETEARVLAAATAEFHEKGFSGARMQEIARRAGLNQSLLHYYYRTKDRLFEAVFSRAVRHVMVPVLEVLGSPLPLREKVERFVHTYIDQVLVNPHVPGFVVEELRRNPDRLRTFMSGHTNGLFAILAAQIEEAVAAGQIRPIAPAHFVANLMALCVFPFVARPMVQTVTGMDDTAYHAFLQQRKEVVVRFFLDALTP
ncbi:MAG: TetR/AcrR family transcriptional regulator [Rhodothermales bacterium]|nr:TetR/AcrR family transcriptional regulator [Rhodothermales bacterium]